jgi:CRISPR-associated protein Cas1
MQKDGRVLYLTEDKNQNNYWNIPIANSLNAAIPPQ